MSCILAYVGVCFHIYFYHSDGPIYTFEFQSSLYCGESQAIWCHQGKALIYVPDLLASCQLTGARCMRKKATDGNY